MEAKGGKIPGRKNKNMKNREIDQKRTKQLVIDAGLHQSLKVKAATSGTSIKELVEGCLAELLEVKGINVK